MTKSHLIALLKEQHPNLPTQKLNLAVETIFNCMAQAIKEGKNVELRRFGTFSSRIHRFVPGKNPLGHKSAKSLYQVPTFRPSKKLLARLNHELHTDKE